jgi:NAD(P)-dependent dehydrogenase (short-subunit alcohol dehydrogenase family)
MNPIRFDNQVVIVTGAGGGLGRAYALDIARRGGRVVVNDLGGSVEGLGQSTAMADAVVAEIRAAGGEAVASYDSVETIDGAKRIAATALDAFGRIDALINNAGNMRMAWFDDSDPEDLEALLSVHLIGSWNMTRVVWPQMKSQGYGRVVFTTSSAGLFGHKMQSGYAAAKAGIVGLMNVLAQEGEPHGILCNALMPNALSRMTDKAAQSMGGEAVAALAPQLERMRELMDPRFNVGLAVYLASDRCNSTHAIYSACLGRIARVFVGVTEGWRGAPGVAPSAEDIAGNIDRIWDMAPAIHTPTSPSDEMRIVLTPPVAN